MQKIIILLIVIYNYFTQHDYFCNNCDIQIPKFQAMTWGDCMECIVLEQLDTEEEFNEDCFDNDDC